MVETYYNGYLRVNNCKEFYTFENGKYFKDVYAEHSYETIESIDSFDSEGNKLGVFENKKHFTKKEVKRIKHNSFTVRQIGYNFFLFSADPYHERTTREIGWLKQPLNNSNLGRFDVEHNDTFYTNSKYLSYEDNLKYTKKPIEVVTSGCSRCITRSSINEFIDLDFIEYRKRKDLFIKQNPELEFQTEWIFKMNIEHLAKYLMCSPGKLFSKTFNKSEQMVKRLMNNINNK